MKRFNGVMLAAVVVAVLTAGSAQAQPYYNVWLQGGWSNAEITQSESENVGRVSGNINGYLAGIEAQGRLWDSFGLGLGVRYTQKGGQGTIDSTYSIPNYANVTEEIGSAEITLDVIEIPLTFSWILDVGANSWVRAYMGAFVGIVVGSHLTGVQSGESVDQDLDDYINNAEWGGLFGASWNYDFDSWSLMVDYRYVAGGTDLTTTNDGLTSRTSELAVGLGLRFGTYN